jgi:large subunit ribosomal protein L21
MTGYAIIALGGKQYRVREGQRLLVDRVKADEGKTFEPTVLFVGGDGAAELSPSQTVTARVVGHVLGEKIRIGKYRPKSGYRRHTGYRSHLSQIEIEAIGGGKRERAKKAPAAKTEVKAAEAKAAEAKASPGETAVRHAHPPKGYEDMTVTQIAEAASGWRRPNIEAALEYEQEHAKRKGAIAALESALAAKEEGQH